MGKRAKRTKVKRKRIPFATTLSPGALTALEELAKQAGLARSGVIEILIRREAAAQGVELEGARPRRKGRQR